MSTTPDFSPFVLSLVFVMAREGGFADDRDDPRRALHAQDLPVAHPSRHTLDGVPLQRSVELIGGDPQKLRAVSKNHFAATKYDLPIVAAVPSLGVPCSPPAIPSFVVPVDVNAIERAATRARPHVAQEGSKIVAPLVAHPYPTPTVRGVPLGAGVLASLSGVRPRPVFARLSPADSSAMGDAPGASNVLPQAPATTDRLGAQDLSEDLHAVAARAAAQPSCSALPAYDLRIRLANHGQAAKRLTSQVKSTHRELAPKVGSNIPHLVTPRHGHSGATYDA